MGWLPWSGGGHSTSSHHTDDCTAPTHGALQSRDVAFAAAFLPLLNDSCGEGYTITINFVITIIVSYVFTIKIFFTIRSAKIHDKKYPSFAQSFSWVQL